MHDSTNRRRRLKIAACVIGGLLVAYVVTAYFILPDLWKWHFRRHPNLNNMPRVTLAGDGIPGDPLNVALIGTEADVKAALAAARWSLADSLSLRSDLKIAEASVFEKPYEDAPVSDLLLFGRKQDLAFEQPVGDNPRQRHHVRFWKTEKVDQDGRPVWVGSAIFDERVGLSRTTGQITHHTAADIDTERDKLFADLRQNGALSDEFVVADFHTDLQGKNGGGDPWHTDGKLYAGTTEPAKTP